MCVRASGRFCNNSEISLALADSRTHSEVRNSHIHFVYDNWENLETHYMSYIVFVRSSRHLFKSLHPSKTDFHLSALFLADWLLPVARERAKYKFMTMPSLCGYKRALFDLKLRKAWREAETQQKKHGQNTFGIGLAISSRRPVIIIAIAFALNRRTRMRPR